MLFSSFAYYPLYVVALAKSTSDNYHKYIDVCIADNQRFAYQTYLRLSFWLRTTSNEIQSVSYAYQIWCFCIMICLFINFKPKTSKLRIFDAYIEVNFIKTVATKPRTLLIRLDFYFSIEWENIMVYAYRQKTWVDFPRMFILSGIVVAEALISASQFKIK